MELSPKSGKILRVLLPALLISLMLIPAVRANLGDIDPEQYGEMTGEQKFEYIFSTEEGAQSKFITQTWQEYNPWEWSYLCIFAVFVSIMIHATLYILGKALGSQGLQRYAISEMLQSAASAIMIIALVGLIIGGFDLVKTVFCGDAGCTIKCMNEDIADPISGDMCRTEELLTAVNKQYIYAHDAFQTQEILYSVTFYMMGFPVYQGSMITEIHKQAETLQYIAHVCVELMFFLVAKMYMLKYLQENMLQFFLPMGIILRTFHFTRGIGAFFIAIGVGFYFIYPTIVFVMDSSFVAENSNFKMPSIISTGMCNLPMFGAFSYGSATLEQINNLGVASGVSLSKNLATFLANLFTHLFYSNMVAFATTLVFVRFATTVLGGDISPFMGMVSRLV